MMEIKELIVFSKPYRIVDVDEGRDESGVLGQTRYKEGKVLLHMDMEDHLLLQTLWHEVFHIAQQDVEGVMRENQARWVSLFIHNFLLENPEVVQTYSKLIKKKKK